MLMIGAVALALAMIEVLGPAGALPARFSADMARFTLNLNLNLDLDLDLDLPWGCTSTASRSGSSPPCTACTDSASSSTCRRPRR
jgi:hypothetical protein